MSTYLGSLCKRMHDYEKTGKSLRRQNTGHCIDCHKLRYAERMKDPEKRRQKINTQNEINKRNADARRQQVLDYYERNRQAICKSRREQRKANIEHAKKIEAAKRDRNREALRISSKNSKAKMRSERAEEARIYARNHYRKNSISIRIRNRVAKALRHQKIKKIFTVSGYGIDVEAIAKHIGPCPGDLKDWHIDHIRPLSSFDFSDASQIAIAFRPENHQWLPAQENLIKHAKYDPICTQN